MHELFGGAFSVQKFPVSYRDVSDIVPVSDNQEIFSDLNEENPQYSGNQLIVEILDKIEQPDDQAIQFNFKDLAEDMNATDVNHQEPMHFTSPE